MLRKFESIKRLKEQTPDMMIGPYWVRLLIADPQIAEECKWESLCGMDWADLLVKRPEYVDKCDWSRLYPQDWDRLLRHIPLFDVYLDAGHWLRLVEMFSIYSSLKPLSCLNPGLWRHLYDHKLRFEFEEVEKREDLQWASGLMEDLKNVTIEQWCSLYPFRACFAFKKKEFGKEFKIPPRPKPVWHGSLWGEFDMDSEEEKYPLEMRIRP